MSRLVFTGGLAHMTRRTAESKARAAGHTVAHSVSSSTDYLVAAGTLTSAKARDAKRLGIPIIGEREFMAMV